MCIVYYKKHFSDQIKLLIASNRDEFYSREYSNISVWENGIIAGKDNLRNGSWLGFNKKGSFAFLTNFRTGQKKAEKKLSRGLLVTQYLAQDSIPSNSELHNYDSFNMVYGDLNQSHFLSNMSKHPHSLPDEFSVSNGNLEDKWPKMNCIESLMAKVDRSLSIDSLKDNIFKILSNETIYNDSQLPNTGMTIEQERLLSSVFISTPKYGTVTQNISMIDKENNLFMFERDIRSNKEELIKLRLTL